MSKTKLADRSPAPAALRVEVLRKRIGTFELEASFLIPPGKRFALLGQSGSGKSSLLRLLAGLENADSGQVLLGQENITALAPQGRGVGFIFQDQALFPALSVLGNAVFGLRMRGVARGEREREGREWLARVGLSGALVDAAIGRLSGGERQRVAFVRATIWKPRFLLLDEPFSALDTGLRVQLRDELKTLHELWPVPLLLVTHDEQDAEALAHERLELVMPETGNLRRISHSGAPRV